MASFLKTTLAVTFVILLISVWALEAKIAERRNKFSSLDTADTKVGGFPLRIKRRIPPFGLMILCKTKRSPFNYYGYGCYCRKGGGRGEPVDDIDGCCQAHDECYDRIKHEKLCAPDLDLYYKGYQREGCSGCDSSRNDDCELAICKCDSVAARCIARYAYNSEYKSYPQEKCL